MGMQLRNRNTDHEASQELPAWASLLIKKFDSYSASTERSLTLTFDRQNSLYSAIIKVRADTNKIDEKMRTIAWVGIKEMRDEETTKRFDKEAVKEVI
ncbi:50S ribosomal protein L23 domain protein [Oesophagostomum dentatum]|uniref:50S ribosomal protein L23 domain protein n=1 Tax=Oesophagostomum dentatum TaxID=61180 RepID=A0A0B1SML9_OESDE|nr:50S ribosomal protein L23 domain protein [Oesophagostomum dentatum]